MRRRWWRRYEPQRRYGAKPGLWSSLVDLVAPREDDSDPDFLWNMLQDDDEQDVKS